MDSKSKKRKEPTLTTIPQINKRLKNQKEDEPSSHQTKPKTKIKYSFTPNKSVPLNSLRSLKADTNVPTNPFDKNPSPNSSPVTNNLGSDDHVGWQETPRQKKTIPLQATNQNLSQSIDTPRRSRIPSSPVSVLKTTPMKDISSRYSIKYNNIGGSQRSPSSGKVLEHDPLDLNLPVPRFNNNNNNNNMKLIPNMDSFTTPSEKKKPLKNINDLSDLLSSVKTSFGSASSTKPIKSAYEEHDTPIKATNINNVIPAASVTKLEEKEEEEVSDDSLFSDDIEFAKLFNKPNSETSSQIIRNKKLQNTESVPVLTNPLKLPKPHILSSTFNNNPISCHNVVQSISPTILTKEPTKQDASDDGFSDDDDDLFMEILNRKATQKSQLESQNLLSSSVSVNTQQRTAIKDADKQGHLAFKRDIDDSQMDAFQYKEEFINKAECAVNRRGVHRFEILKVLDGFYYKNQMKKTQKIISVRDHQKNESKVIVRGFTSALEFQEGDVLHIVGETYKLVDDDTDNLLIWNPDILLSATLISDTINCTRRSVLKQRVEFNGDYSVPLIVGEVVHHVFQGVLAQGKCSMNLMKALMNEAISEHHLTILIIQQLESEVRTICETHLPYIKTWFDSYYKEEPDHRSMIKVNKTNKRVQFSSSNILDVEESIMSHVYGLRGFIDVTIEAHIKTSSENHKLVVPLELKSGTYTQLAHDAQASFYTLMMRDRYEMNVEFFMLVYSKLAQTTINQVTNRQIKELVGLRNKLSQFMRDGTRELPPPIKQDQCNKCYTKNECMTYYKLMEEGKEEDLVLPDGIFDELTGHLNEKHKKFFNYWDDLITKEDAVSKIVGKELYLIDSSTREKAGKCIGHLSIDSIKDDSKNGTGEQKFLYTFKRSISKFGSIGATQLLKQDRVHISDEEGNFSLAKGWIVAISNDTVQISTTKRLTSLKVKLKNFDSKTNQIFQTHLKPLDSTQTIDSHSVTTYRIDKDDMFSGIKTARSNVLNLFLPDGGDSVRRRLIVDQDPPKFSKIPLSFDQPKMFNKDQISAFNKVLSAEDYALILGMPGTGKTTLIAQLIKFLVSNDKTVLLTSYTHSAVDNILIKIQDEDFDILRLGSSLSRIHPEIHRFSHLTKNIKTSIDLDTIYFKPPVVATTCLSINDWIFNRRKFDYCIVDESSQVSMPVCLGPLKFCDKFVLVGDHYQLPPLVQNPKAKGLSKSLFKMLSEQSPESVVELTYQYRMCEDIMLLTNTIIYEGRLKCGSDEVAKQSLLIPNISKLNDHLVDKDLPINKRWLNSVLDPQKKVLFLNHDEVGDCHETKFKENIENVKEAELIRQIAEAFLTCGLNESSIGIMSFYRAQLRRLQRSLKNYPNMEKLTADQFQGRDKDCIIISLVKSNDMNDAGSLLKEWRRVNVAITRARSKLIVIGSKKTLSSLETINAFLNILNSRGWSYDMPFQADKFYKFEQDTTIEIKTNLTKSVKNLKILEKRPLIKEIIEETFGDF